jgi:hypothetical protein
MPSCWMCLTRKVKQYGRCKTCKEERCIACGGELTVFVRTLHAVKFRKRQWKHEIYEHETLIKTRTFEKLCLNPDCPKHWDATKLPPDWIPVQKAKLELPKKTFDEAVNELEQSIS